MSSCGKNNNSDVDGHILLSNGAKPTSAAEQVVPLHFSPSAKAVEWLLITSGMQSYVLFCVVQCNERGCNDVIDSLIKSNNLTYSKHISYARKNLRDSPKIEPPDTYNHSHWWKPEDIKDGFFIDSEESYGLKMWIDTTNSKIYLYQSD